MLKGTTGAAICILMITTPIQGYNYGGSLALAKNDDIPQVRIVFREEKRERGGHLALKPDHGSWSCQHLQKGSLNHIIHGHLGTIQA